MSSIASKNLYELLGNDPELDPERATPQPPVKTVDKPAARTGKRNAPAEAPARSGDAARSAPKDSGNNNDNYLRDRNVGADKNRSRGARYEGEDFSRGGERGGRGRGRGRGGRGGARGDRHSRTGVADHEKQVAHGWGATDGNAELADETAGEAIAQKEEKEAVAEDAAAPEGEAPAEPEEEKTKSYQEYLAELAEKKLALGSQNVRKANEGSSAKFPEGTAITREDEDASYIAASGGKNKRTRERKEKAFVELDGDRLLQPAPRDNFGGRGRGGRGRGEGRGEFRGRGRGRGGESRGEGRPRGGRGGAQSGPNLNDSSAFPSLGA